MPGPDAAAGKCCCRKKKGLELPDGWTVAWWADGKKWRHHYKCLHPRGPQPPSYEH